MKRKIYYSIGVSALFILALSLFIGIFWQEEGTITVKISDLPLECVAIVENKSKNIEQLEYVSESNISEPYSPNACKEQKIETVDKTFNLAGTNIPMVFVDGDWSDELKNLVYEDVNLVFSHLTNYAIINDPCPPEAYQLNGETIISTYYISFKGRGRIWPDEYDSERGRLIISKEDEFLLVVSKELIEAYQKAIEFKAMNIDSFNKIDGFINKMNTFAEMNGREFLDSIIVVGSSDDNVINEKNYHIYANDCGQWKYTKYSILGFESIGKFVQSGVTKISDKTPPHSVIANVRGVHNDGRISLFGIIYLNDQWRIIIPFCGT